MINIVLTLAQLKKEGEQGGKQINGTRYMTVSPNECWRRITLPVRFLALRPTPQIGTRCVVHAVPSSPFQFMLSSVCC
jgi:hypothetical protein